jgi:cytochrome c oxidase assembly factor CtaG
MLLGIGLILIAVFEILALYRARREGHTQNISRLVSHTLVVLLVLTMVGLSLLKWSDYVSAEGHARLPKAAHSN